MAGVSLLEDLFPYGTVKEQKEFIGPWVEKTKLHPLTRVGRSHEEVPVTGERQREVLF